MKQPIDLSSVLRDECLLLRCGRKIPAPTYKHNKYYTNHVYYSDGLSFRKDGTWSSQFGVESQLDVVEILNEKIEPPKKPLSLSDEIDYAIIRAAKTKTDLNIELIETFSKWLLPKESFTSEPDWPEDYYRLRFTRWERDQELRRVLANEIELYKKGKIRV